jgi:hypothetical protein
VLRGQRLAAVERREELKREKRKREMREEVWHVGPTATWHSRKRNQPPKPPDEQLWMILRVGWSRILGFGLQWSQPNWGKS